MASILGGSGSSQKDSLGTTKVVSLILGCVFVMVGLFVSWHGLTFLRTDSKIPKGYYVTSAVEKVDDFSVRFYVGGVEYLIEDVEFAGNRTLKVAYNPNNPLENKFLKYSDKSGLAYVFIGLGFSGIGVILVCIEWLPRQVLLEDEEC